MQVASAVDVALIILCSIIIDACVNDGADMENGQVLLAHPRMTVCCLLGGCRGATCLLVLTSTMLNTRGGKLVEECFKTQNLPIRAREKMVHQAENFREEVLSQVLQ